MRIRHLRRVEQDYALLNDSGHDFAALHYYIYCDSAANSKPQDSICERFSRPTADCLATETMTVTVRACWTSRNVVPTT